MPGGTGRDRLQAKGDAGDGENANQPE